MPKRGGEPRILVHRCVDPRRFPGPSSTCRCSRWVKKSLADRMVERRDAVQLAGGDVAVIAKAVKQRTPRADTITQRNMEVAYTGISKAARDQRRRIEIYGAMNRAELEGRIVTEFSP